MAAAERGGALAQRLRPYAASPEFLLAPDTCKDAIDLLAAQYDQLPEEKRRELETDLLAHPFDEYAHPEQVKEGFLRRLFGTVGAKHLSTDEARAVVAAAPENDATNDRLCSITSDWVESSDDYRWLNQEAKADPAVRKAIVDLDLIREKLRLGSRGSESIEDLETALSALGELSKLLNDEAIPDRGLLHQAEGSFAQGVHKLVTSGHSGPNTGQKLVVQLVEWIEDASRLGNPETDEDTEIEFEKSPHWCSPSARLEAATAAQIGRAHV